MHMLVCILVCVQKCIHVHMHIHIHVFLYMPTVGRQALVGVRVRAPLHAGPVGSPELRRLEGGGAGHVALALGTPLW